MKTRNRLKRGTIWIWMKENYSFVLVIITILLSLLLIDFLTFGAYYRDAKNNAVTIGSMTVA